MFALGNGFASAQAVDATAFDPAASGATTQTMTVLIVDAPSAATSPKPSTTTACQALTAGLARRVLPVGEPPFRVTRCRFVKANVLSKAYAPRGFYALLQAGAKPVRLELTWRPAAGAAPITLSSLELSKPTLDALLANREILMHAASTALASSPVAATIDATKFEAVEQKPVVMAMKRTKDLPATAKVRLFSLSWHAGEQRWEPRVFADLTLQKQAYQGTWQRLPGKDVRVAYLHDADGPQAAAAVWRERLDAAIIATDTRRLDLLSARSSLPRGMAVVDSFGHIGLRVGQQMATGSELLASAQYISIYAEATGKYIGGLRASLELVPTVTAEVDGATQEFGWRRVGIGYSFGFNVPWLIDRVEIVPRATLWTFKAVVPYENLETSSPEEFKVDDQLSQGVNVAVVSLLGDFLIKPWYGRDIEMPIKQLKLGSSLVQTTNIGLDLYFSRSSWRIGSRPFGVLAFAFGEQIAILKGEDDEGAVRRRIDIQDMFAGLGTLISF